MNVNVIMPELEINTTPLENITIDSCTIEVEFDDINEIRYKLTAVPYQAIKITTVDCVSSQGYYNKYCFRDGIFHRHILQIENSEFIRELISGASDPQILAESKHFVLPMQDNVIEFVSYGFELIKAQPVGQQPKT